VNWITVPSTIHTGPGSTSYTVARNNTAQSRTGIIIVAAKTFTVRQYGNGCHGPPLDSPPDRSDALIFGRLAIVHRSVCARESLIPYKLVPFP
jgi:hypothetical protein